MTAAPKDDFFGSSHCQRTKQRSLFVPPDEYFFSAQEREKAAKEKRQKQSKQATLPSSSSSSSSSSFSAHPPQLRILLLLLLSRVSYTRTGRFFGAAAPWLGDKERGGGKRRLDRRRPTSVELAGEEEEGEEGEFSKMTARWMLGNRPGQI